MILYIISLCEKVTDGSLWLAFGISRENSHIIMDFIASHCTIVMIDESIIRSILIQMMGDSTLEENGIIFLYSMVIYRYFNNSKYTINSSFPSTSSFIITRLYSQVLYFIY